MALNTIAQEFALHDALGPYPLSRHRHLPGVSTDVAAAAPRQYAPEAKAFPLELASVQRTLVPARNASYYHRLRCARAQ
eukprot:8306499-Alexandrium_andersonii.AAC.1